MALLYIISTTGTLWNGITSEVTPNKGSQGKGFGTFKGLPELTKRFLVSF